VMKKADVVGYSGVVDWHEPKSNKY
jgi:hypothetical protein